jgi:hypothetical protein
MPSGVVNRWISSSDQSGIAAKSASRNVCSNARPRSPRAADAAPCCGAVGGDQVGRRAARFAAVGAAQRHVERRAVRLARDERDAALDRHAEAGEMLGEQALGDALVEQQQVRIARVQRIEIEPCDHAAIGMQRGRMHAVAEREEWFDRAMLLEQLERARLDADRAGMRGGHREAVDDAHRHAGTREAHRRGEAGGTRADDQHGWNIEQCVSHETLDDTRPCQSTPLRVTGPYADRPIWGRHAQCGKIRAFRQF